MLLASIGFLCATFIFCLYYLHRCASLSAKAGLSGAQSIILPMSFLFAIMLYTLPLPISLLQANIEYSSVYQDVQSFSSYIPAALGLVSFFMFVFSICYRATLVTLLRKSVMPVNSKKYSVRVFKVIWALFLVVSFLLILKLASYVGGVSSLILSGYSVTKLLSENGVFAVGFSWLTAISILAFAYGMVSRSKFWFVCGVLLITLCLVSFIIMGRRGVLVLYCLSLLITHALCYQRLRYVTYLLIFTAGFMFLNLVGLLRGASYDSLSDLFNTLTDRYSYVSESAEVSVFYTLTEGNFVVPFQTLPNIMANMGGLSELSLGGVTLKGLLLLIPNFIWPDRPLPLANWYMLEFVDANAGMNEGRQFFFLSEGYLNFGAFGVVVWGILYGVLLSLVSFYFVRRRSSFVHVVLFSLLVGNVLSFVASDTIGGAVAFLKSYGLPCILIIVMDYFLRLRERSQ